MSIVGISTKYSSKIMCYVQVFCEICIYILIFDQIQFLKEVKLSLINP